MQLSTYQYSFEYHGIFALNTLFNLLTNQLAADYLLAKFENKKIKIETIHIHSIILRILRE